MGMSPDRLAYEEYLKKKYEDPERLAREEAAYGQTVDRGMSQAGRASDYGLASGLLAAANQVGSIGGQVARAETGYLDKTSSGLGQASAATLSGADKGAEDAADERRRALDAHLRLKYDSALRSEGQEREDKIRAETIAREEARRAEDEKRRARERAEDGARRERESQEGHRRALELKGLDNQAKRDQLLSKGDASFNALPKEKQIEVSKLAEKTSTGKAVVDKIKSELGVFRKHLDSGDEDMAVAVGLNMLKVLNSAEGQDAVGEGEADRLASFLKHKLFNFTNPGSMFGRDMDKFDTQLTGKIQAIEDATKLGENRVDEIYGRQPQHQVAVDAAPRQYGEDGTAIASPGGKPKTIRQGGHVYTLNEATGEYE